MSSSVTGNVVACPCTVSCNIEQMEAGSWQEIIIDYELGASGMADGSWFKATFRFYSDWALFQTADPAGANYISAEYHAAPTIPGQSPATVQKLSVRFDQKGHERPFQKAVIVDTYDGYLKAGDHIIIRLGDRRFGGAGTRVQTFVEEFFRIRCYVDPLGTSRFASIGEDLVIDIKPGAPAQLMWAGSRIVRAGEKFPLRLRSEDQWGNTCWNRADKVAITATLDGKPVYEKQAQLATQGWAVLLLDDLPTAEAGKPPERPAQLDVAVDAKGNTTVNRNAAPAGSAAALSEVLKRAAGDMKDPVIVINADANASHQSVVRVMEAAQLAGYPKITFTTQAARK